MATLTQEEKEQLKHLQLRTLEYHGSDMVYLYCDTEGPMLEGEDISAAEQAVNVLGEKLGLAFQPEGSGLVAAYVSLRRGPELTGLRNVYSGCNEFKTWFDAEIAKKKNDSFYLAPGECFITAWHCDEGPYSFGKTKDYWEMISNLVTDSSSNVDRELHRIAESYGCSIGRLGFINDLGEPGSRWENYRSALRECEYLQGSVVTVQKNGERRSGELKRFKKPHGLHKLKERFNGNR